VLAVAAAGTFAAAGHAATYYVSPGGSDANPGTAPGSAWQTVHRVNGASLVPGDSVLFQGGQTFSDDTLMPSHSGTAGAPITFGSYGSGDATLTNPNGAVWFSGLSDVTFQHLHLTTGNANHEILAGSGGGGSHDITVSDCVLDNSAGAAINSPNSGDSNWQIVGNTISHVGDSGLIIEGSGATIVGNTISDTGWNPAITYGKHGIYAKGPDMTIAGNDISRDTNGSAISLRYHGARVYGNAIHDTAYALSYFPDDPANAGSLLVYDNRIWGISGFALYYSGQASAVGLVFASNTVLLAGAPEAVDVSEAGNANVSLVNNVFAGSYGTALRAPAQAGGSFSEHDNLWFGAAGTPPSGAGDSRADPQLAAAPALTPASASPVVDAGTASVGGLIYVSSCNGDALSYCGAAPDLGAVESTAAPTTPPAPTPPPAPPAEPAQAPGSGSDSGAPAAGTGSTATSGAPAKKSAKAHAPRARGPKQGRRLLSLELRTSAGRSSVRHGSVTVVARAGATAGIRQVTFHLDGRRVCRVTRAPYSCRVTVRRSVGHLLTATALDHGGKTSSARLLLAASGTRATAGRRSSVH
jgi:Right handed beta helix region